MRRSRLLFAIVIAALVTGPPTWAEVYKTVDKDGKVTYSDRPSDGAEPVKVAPTNRMTETAPPAPAPTAKAAAPERPYTMAAITEPADGATISDPIGNFTVRYTLEPQRRPNDSVRLLMDNAPTGTPVADGIMIKGALRGDHRLQLQVVGPDGQLLAQSSGVRVLVVRAPGGARKAGTPGPTPH